MRDGGSGLKSALERSTAHFILARTRMKKVFLAVIGILLVAVALAVLPFWAGQKSQQSLDHWVAQMNQLGGYDLRWEKYQRNWMDTEAVLRVGLKMPASLKDLDVVEDLSLPLQVHLHHGPVMWRDGAKIGWFSGKFYLSGEHQSWVEKNLTVDGEGPFFVSEIQMDLLGKTTIRDRSLPFEVNLEEDNQLVLAGYQGEGTVSRNGLVQYRGILSAVNVRGEDEKDNMQLKDMEFRVNSDFGGKVGQYLIPGSAEFTLASMSASGDAGEAFSLRDATFSTDMTFNKEKTAGNMRMVMAFGELNVLEEKVENAKLDFSFNNLSVTFLDKYMELVQQMYNGGGEVNPLLAMQMMGLVASDLLPAGPQLSIKELGFKTAEGALSFNGKVSVSPEAAKSMSDPMAMLSHITMDAAFSADKPLAFRLARESALKDLNAEQFEGGEQMTEEEKQALADNQAQMKLDMLIIQGTLVDKGEQYQSQFSFKNGKAEVNGQPLPLPF